MLLFLLYVALGSTFGFFPILSVVLLLVLGKLVWKRYKANQTLYEEDEVKA